MTRWSLVLALALAACGGEDGPPEPDAALVDALVEIHLADARAALDSTATDTQALADSLKTLALRTHGLDSTAMAERLDRLAADPDLARATYVAIDARLTRERSGISPTDSSLSP